MTVKAEMIRPRAGDQLGIGCNRLFGVAWAGEDAVQRVEVCTDGGTTWAEANLIGPQAAYSWTLWEYLWEVNQTGDHDLLVRAISTRGAVQPDHHDTLNGGYLIHHCRPTRVRVTAGRRQAQPADV